MQGPGPETLVLLNQTTVVAVGGLLTTLGGAIGFLFRAMMAALHEQLQAEREAHAETRKDRDYWRDLALDRLAQVDASRAPPRR